MGSSASRISIPGRREGISRAIAALLGVGSSPIRSATVPVKVSTGFIYEVDEVADIVDVVEVGHHWEVYQELWPSD